MLGMLFTVTDILANSASETLTPIKRRGVYLIVRRLGPNGSGKTTTIRRPKDARIAAVITDAIVKSWPRLI